MIGNTKFNKYWGQNKMKKVIKLTIVATVALAVLGVGASQTAHAASKAKTATVKVQYVNGKKVLKTVKSKVKVGKKFQAKKVAIKGYLAPKSIKKITVKKSTILKIKYTAKQYKITVKYVNDQTVLKTTTANVAYATNYTPQKFAFSGYIAPKSISKVKVTGAKNIRVNYQQTKAMFVTAIENSVLKYTNQYRAKNGVAALKMNDTLLRYATSKSALQAKNQSLNHGDPFGDIAALGFGLQQENLGMVGYYSYYSNAEADMAAWVMVAGLYGDSGHGETMLNPYMNVVGMGVTVDAKNVVWLAQDYGNVSALNAQGEYVYNEAGMYNVRDNIPARINLDGKKFTYKY